MSNPSKTDDGVDHAQFTGRRAVIIEDQKLFAEFLAATCRYWGLEIELVTKSGIEGLAKIRAVRPDLVLLDFSLPDIDGLEVARQVLADCATVRIIGISSHLAGWTMLRVQRMGLHGFVDKHHQSSEMLKRAVAAVLDGRVFYTPTVAEASMRLRQDPKAFIRVLSDYELRILTLIGRAKNDVEIATELGVSPATVQSRRRDIMKKLDIHTTPKLIHFALANGLTRIEQFTNE